MQCTVSRDEGADVLKRVVDLAVVWTLLITTLPGVFVIDIFPSQTAAVFTSYALIGLAVAARFWRQAARLASIASSILVGLTLTGWLTWSAYLGSTRTLDYWQAWVLASSLLIFGLAFAHSNDSSWRKILLWAGILAAVVQDLSLMTSRQLLATKLATAGTSEFYGARPIGASVAMLMVVAFAASLYFPCPAPWGILVPGFLGINVVLCQHRSVWVAMAFVCTLSMLNLRSTPLARYAVTGVSITSVFCALALLGPLIGIRLLPTSRVVPMPNSPLGLPEVISSSSSLTWRLDMWQSRLTSARSLSDWLTGGTLGITPVRVPGADVMNPSLSAHSQYVDLLTMLGAVGLALVLGLLVAAVVATHPVLPWVWAVLWGLTAYGVFYSWPVWSWILIGIGLSAAKAEPRQSSSPQEHDDRGTG